MLVVGKSADSLSNQAGGWSLTWQGTENTNQDYPNADTLLTAIRAVVGQDKVVFSETGKDVDPSRFDVVVAVIGETPYAEFNGDIVASDTLAHSRRHPEDLAVLQAAAATGKPVVTVFFSGRPLYANDLINLSQAFVAAWLPGTEGKGVTDVLFASEGDKHGAGFPRSADVPLARRSVPRACGSRGRGTSRVVRARLWPGLCAVGFHRSVAGRDHDQLR